MWFSQDQTRLSTNAHPRLENWHYCGRFGSRELVWAKKKKGQEARIFQIFGDHGSPLNVVSKNDRLEGFV